MCAPVGVLEKKLSLSFSVETGKKGGKERREREREGKKKYKNKNEMK